MIYLLSALIGCSMTLLVFWRYCYISNVNGLCKIALFLLSIIAGCVPIIIKVCQEKSFMEERVFVYFHHSLYFIFIFIVILLTITVLRDIMWLFSYRIVSLFEKNFIICPFSYSHILMKCNTVTFFLALVISVYSLYEGLRVPSIKYVEFFSEKILDEQKIVLLTDLHISRIISSSKINGIVEVVNDQNPDVILLAGDILDDKADEIGNLVHLLERLKSKEGIYFVTGNHEFYTGYRNVIDTIKKLNFVFLENSGISVNDQMYIAGIPDVFSYKYHGIKVDLNEAFHKSKNSQFRILISHTPFDFYKNNNFDLEVAGHTHGGQIFPFHIFSYLYNAYFAGLYNMKNGAKIYVSSGSGQWGPQMRFLSQSEITVIMLFPKDAKKRANFDLLH